MLLTREPEARVEIPESVLVFTRFPDVLDDVGVHGHVPIHRLVAVDGHAVPLLDGREAGGLNHLVGPLTPIAGAEGRNRKAEGQRVEAQGEH